SSSHQWSVRSGPVRSGPAVAGSGVLIGEASPGVGKVVAGFVNVHGECSPLPVGPTTAPPATSTAPPRSRRPPETCRIREPDLSWALRSRRGQVPGGVERGLAEPDEPGSCGRALGPDAVATLDSPLVTTTEPNRWTDRHSDAVSARKDAYEQLRRASTWRLLAATKAPAVLASLQASLP